MRPNIKFADVDDLATAKVLRYYEQPEAREYQRLLTWDLLSYWALAVLFTVCITLAAS